MIMFPGPLLFTMGSSEKSHVEDLEKVETDSRLEVRQDGDAEFGGTEARKKLERKLLWKVGFFCFFFGGLVL